MTTETTAPAEFKPYPSKRYRVVEKTKENPDGVESCYAQNEAEDKALGKGWYDSPKAAKASKKSKGAE